MLKAALREPFINAVNCNSLLKFFPANFPQNNVSLQQI